MIIVAGVAAKLRETRERGFSLVTVICDARRDAPAMHRVNACCPESPLRRVSLLVTLLIMAMYLTLFRNNALNYFNFAPTN